MEFGRKWVHMARYEFILRLDGALWLPIIFKPLLTPKGAIKDPKKSKKSKKIQGGPLLLSTRGGGIGTRCNVVWQYGNIVFAVLWFVQGAEALLDELCRARFVDKERQLTTSNTSCVSANNELVLAGLARTLRLFFLFFGSFIAPFGVRRGLKMILSHRAPSSLNISPYRAIWTHFRPIFMIFIHLILQTGKSCWHLGHVHDTFTIDSRQIHHRFTRDAS